MVRAILLAAIQQQTTSLVAVLTFPHTVGLREQARLVGQFFCSALPCVRRGSCVAHLSFLELADLTDLVSLGFGRFCTASSALHCRWRRSFVLHQSPRLARGFGEGCGDRYTTQRRVYHDVAVGKMAAVKGVVAVVLVSYGSIKGWPSPRRPRRPKQRVRFVSHCSAQCVRKWDS